MQIIIYYEDKRKRPAILNDVEEIYSAKNHLHIRYKGDKLSENIPWFEIKRIEGKFND